MEYRFTEIEKFATDFWQKHDVYKVYNDEATPKYYVLDMFPYPSGAGLHVGHPLGYIASDIFARYKKMQGFNVLHPMGFDAFGLPAEQYALETGQHPAETTEKNIARYKEQLNNIGFNYDWSREIVTSHPDYYQWTQWIFLQLFDSWFDVQAQKARPLSELKTIFATAGNHLHPAPANDALQFDAAAWLQMTEVQQRQVLMNYRLAYLADAEVWWCEALGTVLANDEVVNGVSERGGHPVEKRKLKQWFLRITAYAERLLKGLETLDWSESMIDMQRNWIGRSTGAAISFPVQHSDANIEVFTTRPDTIFGVDFMVLAPEHELVASITTPEQQSAVQDYITYVRSRSERERMAEKKISGAFTGAYVTHPFTQQPIPVWISEYVLAGYGTGAIMAVPSGDERDHAFAQFFNIPITNIFGDSYDGTAAVSDKHAVLGNSDFLTGKNYQEALPIILEQLAAKGTGKAKVNYKLRDAGFGRQRYWGEPFPIVYNNGVAYSIFEEEVDLPASLRSLPVELPYVKNYGPGPDGEGPLANLPDWVNITHNGKTYRRETSTMPGFAGSSWYFLRYMDPLNGERFAGAAATKYWNQVDLYIGGTEHAVGHLMYSRMWTKVLYDLGYIHFEEPFKKLLNQGMIQGSSRFVYRLNGTDIFVSEGLVHDRKVDKLHVDVSLVDGVTLDINKFKDWRDDYKNASFELEDGQYICGVETEKMSKSKYNVVNPDDIVAQYGADTFRMYEMFLGPIEQSKPWDTKGIEGVHRFLKKFWRLFYDEQKGWVVNDVVPSEDELKLLNRSIKKITDDTERFSFNTAVSQFMIVVNELTASNSHKRALLEPLVRLLAPYAPHAAEYLYEKLGHKESVVKAAFPTYEAQYVVDNEKVYPVAINGKTRTELSFPLDTPKADIEAAVMANEIVQKWLEGKAPKKIIFVPGKMINVVL